MVNYRVSRHRNTSVIQYDVLDVNVQFHSVQTIGHTRRYPQFPGPVLPSVQQS
jgi:hypothetical protein